MPARRSRTMEWRRCLEEISARNGSIEIAVQRDSEDGENGSHLIWRVRLLEVNDDHLVIAEPMTLGQTIHLQPGVSLVGIMTIGQNRWMFETNTIGTTTSNADRRPVTALRLTMPTGVERCQRRNYDRVSTVGVNMPRVEMWPLLNPKSVIPAEKAYAMRFRECVASPGKELSPLDITDLMPDVGPEFPGTLVNIGGGGLGVIVDPNDASILARHKVFWMRFTLPQEMSTPICATGKLVHTHIQSDQSTYCGMAFDFTFNPSHQRLVVDQICRYAEVRQGRQLDERELRKSA